MFDSDYRLRQSTIAARASKAAGRRISARRLPRDHQSRRKSSGEPDSDRLRLSQQIPFGRVAHCGPAGRAGRYTDGTAPGPTSKPIPPALRARSQPEPEAGNPPTQTINAGLHDHHGADAAPKMPNFPASVGRPPRLRAPRSTWLHSTRHLATRVPREARTQLALCGVDEARSEAADPTRASDAWLPSPEPVESMAEQPAGRRRSHRSSCASSPRWAVRARKLAN